MARSFSRPSMKLSDLLSPDLVCVPLEAGDKWAAITAMVRTAVGAGRVPVDRAPAVEEALVVREQSMTTGMEDGIAIPHAAVDGLDEVVAVLGLSPGIPFESLDGKDARIIVCLIIPRAKKLVHIKTLAEIAKLLSRAEVRGALLECTGPDQVLAVLARHEGS